jgi:neutral ceramidase
MRFWLCLAVVLLAAGACGGDDDAAGGVDASPPVTTEHCDYQGVAATTGAGGEVTPGQLQAGAAEAVLDIPVGTALGAYTERAGFLGSAGTVDSREPAIAGGFNASIGVELAPRVKALALGAGGETVVLIKLDLGLVYEGMLFDVEERLGLPGKVLLAASHSHSAWGQQTGSHVFKVGLGEFRQLVYQRYLDQIEAVARAALDARRPARLGVFHSASFDPDDAVTRDRREDNDELMGGPRKDDQLFLVRVDDLDGAPIAAVPVFGIHGTINGADNLFASADAPGYIERVLEERIGQGVVVMHLQGAGADVSPTGHGELDCTLKPGREGDPCYGLLRAEGTGRAALAELYQAWSAAGEAMSGELALEMLTRSIELGPWPETFAVRGGALSYAGFDLAREADRAIFDDRGRVLSPIDEFNAPVGASLCEEEYPLFPAGLMPGVDGLAPYGSCVRLDVAAPILADLIELDLPIDAAHPSCQATRTTVSALRLGDYLVATVPGELSVMLADRIRSGSPAEPDKTIAVGYAQGHIGYALTAEDWLQGGYESSINGWGPLEAERIGEEVAELLPLALSPEREDGAAGGSDRVATLSVSDDLAIDDPAPGAGSVPDTLPDDLWLRVGTVPRAQPDASVPRVAGHALFVWIGEDPLTATPVVTLERETAPDTFEPARRRSGRAVRDGELLLAYTPIPLRRAGDEPQTHYWAVEWQAVGWLGMLSDVAGLEGARRVPLGRYRFHVEGAGYQLDSDPFEVVPAALEVSAVRDGSSIRVTTAMRAAKGYRLLDMTAPSNQPVPLRGAAVEVRLTQGTGADIVASGTTDGDGVIAVDAGADAGDVVSAAVTDGFGNAGSASL